MGEGRDEDVTDAVHPDNIEIALKASKLFGLKIIGCRYNKSRHFCTLA